MADDTRRAAPDLGARVEDIENMNFFRMLALLEKDGLRFGRSGGPDREPARLGQSARLSFATSDIARLTPAENDGEKPKVAVNVLGLIGPEGPMPLHMTRWIMERMSTRWFTGDSPTALADTSFLDMVNMLQHRMLAFYWRAWADMRPEINLAHEDGGRVTAMLRSLAGLGLPGTLTGDTRIDGAKLHHATSLFQNTHGPERLTSFISTILGIPVTLHEFVGIWIAIPEQLQTRLSHSYVGLGKEAVLGTRVYDRLSRAKLRVGPLTLQEFTTFLNDNLRWKQLRHAIIFASGKEIDYDLQLVLKANEVPAAKLGECQLSRTTWLNRKSQTDADDLCFTRITQNDPPLQPKRAAA
jgi:type VI secretion system protein ImpH